jgi:hypothetical protein
MVERRLKNLNLLTAVVVIREDRTIQQHVEDCSRRNCLFAIIINSSNEIHRSVTVNILHGVAQGQFYYPFHGSILGSIHILGGSGPARAAHGLLDIETRI